MDPWTIWLDWPKIDAGLAWTAARWLFFVAAGAATAVAVVRRLLRARRRRSRRPA